MGLLEPHGRGRRLFRRAELSENAPVIVVHSLAQAVAAAAAAAEAKRPITLLSAPDAGISAGAGWWREVIAAARASVPTAGCSAVLDCGDDAGAAQAAIRAGVEAIIFTGRADVAERLGDIARQAGVRMLPARPEIALDLADMFFAAAEDVQQHCAALLLAD